MQEVEGVEELLLGSFLALHELDVVDEQYVAVVAVATLERVRGVGADGVDELGDEGFRGHVAHAALGIHLLDIVPDGLEEVGLAEARIAVDE